MGQDILALHAEYQARLNQTSKPREATPAFKIEQRARSDRRDQGKDRLFGGFGNDVLKGGTWERYPEGRHGQRPAVREDAMDGQSGNDFCNGNIGTDTAVNCEQTLGLP